MIRFKQYPSKVKTLGTTPTRVFSVSPNNRPMGTKQDVSSAWSNLNCQRHVGAIFNFTAHFYFSFTCEQTNPTQRKNEEIGRHFHQEEMPPSPRSHPCFHLSVFTADSKIRECISPCLLYILIVCLFYGFNTFVVMFRELMRPLKSFFLFYCWKPTWVSNLIKSENSTCILKDHKSLSCSL